MTGSCREKQMIQARYFSNVFFPSHLYSSKSELPLSQHKLISFGFCSKKIWRRKSDDVFCHVNKSEVHCWISHWISDIWNNWSFLQKEVLWRRLMLQFSVAKFCLSRESGQFNTDKTVLSSDKFHKGYLWNTVEKSNTLEKWEERQTVSKGQKKHYNVKVMRFSTAEDVLIWMKWQIQEIWFKEVKFSLYASLWLSVTTDRWWIFLDLTKRLTICLWQVSETSLWQRLWTSSLQLIHL